MSGLQPPAPSFPAANSAQRAGERRKVPLKPGRSLMDWVRVTRGKNLGGVGGTQRVTTTELSKHCTIKDAWTAVRGRVYNISPYMEYHPGGVDELMRAAGIDCSPLFDEYHAWVNFETTLKTCFVGYLVPDASESEDHDTSSTTISAPTEKVVDKDGFAVPAPPCKSDVKELPWGHEKLADGPARVWFTIPPLLVDGGIANDAPAPSVHVDSNAASVVVHIESASSGGATAVEVHLDADTVCPQRAFVREYSSQTGVTVVVELQDASPATTWSRLGTHTVRALPRDTGGAYQHMKIVEKRQATHDTLFVRLASCGRLVAPGGHVVVKAPQPTPPLLRSYTAIASTREHLDLLIKVYPNGKLTSQLLPLAVHDTLAVSRPLGAFNVRRQLMPTTLSRIVMVAGGTGLTPMLRLIRYLYATHSDVPKHVTLIAAFHSQRDILERTTLEHIAKHCPFASLASLQIHWVLTQYDQQEDTGAPITTCAGRIDEALLRELLGGPCVDYRASLALVCGRSDFTHAVTAALRRLDYATIHTFL